MKLTIFLILIVTIFISACSNSQDRKETSQSHLNEGTIRPVTLQAGLEARTNQQSALWSEKELKMLEGPNWAHAKAGYVLKTGAKVYVAEVGDEYAKVMTLIGQDGYIIKELLDPMSKESTDSTKYFEKKRIGRINTFVDGFDVGTVRIWANMTSRDRLVDKLSKNEKVVILLEEGEYVQVGTINGTVGWCMRDFVKY